MGAATGRTDMGITRQGGGTTGSAEIEDESVRREDLATSGVESIRRNAAGQIQFQQVATHTNTGITGSHTFQTTITGRAFAENVNASVTTSGTPGAGTLQILRNGSAVASTPATTTVATSTSQTFNAVASPTWTIQVTGVTGGTVNLTAGTISREDTRS